MLDVILFLLDLAVVLMYSCPGGGGGGALGYFLGGYGPPGTPNWHPDLEKISP